MFRAKKYSKKNGIIFSDLCFHSKELNSISKHQIGILGWEEQSLNCFREQFYNLGDHFQCSFLDLGVINQDHSIQSIEQLSKQISLILIGGPSNLFANDQKVIVSKKFDPNENATNIGYQRHLLARDDYYNIDSLDHLSLGSIKKEIAIVEPLLRECSKIQIHIDCIKRADSQSVDSEVCGLSLEEACQLSRYAGISSELDFLHFPDINKDQNSQVFECLALMSWYYTEGFMHKNFESATDYDNTCYIIENESIASPIKFYNNVDSGRWWVQMEENKIVPCLFQDYLDCKKGNVPDKLLPILI